MNTFYFIVQQTMFFAIPLLIVSLGGLCSERSGISNIALEGIMIIGAFAGVLVIKNLGDAFSGQFVFLLAILAGALAGGLYSLLHAWSSIRLKADQTISGTALNLFAPAFCIFTARSIYGVKQVSFSGSFFIDRIPVLSDIPVLGPCFFTNCYLSTFIGLALWVVFAFIFEKTRFGMRLSACGENPDAAAAAGISVTGMRYCGVILSGLLGGAGGIIFIVPTSTNFSSDVFGYGFLALAVLILGQWKPLGIMLSAFFFGVLKAVASAYSGVPFLASLPVPSEIFKIVPYFLTLLVLIISSKRSIAPKAVGIPYDDGAGFVSRDPKARRILLTLFVVSLVSVTALAAICSSSLDKRGSTKGYGAELALVIPSSASIDDKSFNQAQWEGIVQYAQDNNKTVKYYQSKDDSDEALIDAVALAVKGNAKIVVLSSNSFSIPLYKTQEKYPDVHFILTDSIPYSADGEEKIAPNTLCLFVDELQSGFLAGYAAVMDGYRNLGAVGGVAMSSVIRFGYGFVSGAEYAAKELGLAPGSVDIIYTYAGTFSASPEMQALASAWYQSGTEIIFSFAGTVGNSIMKAAEVYDKYVIGVDVDQSGESDTVVTSAVKNLRSAIMNVLDQFYAGQLVGGKAASFAAAENSVSLPMETSKFRSFTQEQYDAIYSKLASGEIRLYSDTDISSVEELPLEYVNLRLVK